MADSTDGLGTDGSHGTDSSRSMVGVDEAQEIADRMRRLAGSIARQQAQFLQLLDRIDRSEAWTHWIGVRTLAQWVSFVCEMDSHTAREHIRVMRGLRELPQVASLLEEGKISFSKAREITRLSGRIADEEAAEITRHATASQISAMVAAYRRLDSADPEELLESLVGRMPEDIAEVRVPRTPSVEAADTSDPATDAELTVRLPRRLEQDSLHVSTQQYGRARIILDLPEADAIELLEALDAVRDRLERADEPEDNGSDGSESDGGGEETAPPPVRAEHRATRVDALLEVLREHRDEVTRKDRGRAARATVVVHVSPEALGAGSGAENAEGAEGADVPAGTSQGRQERCHTAERGPLTTASAARLACGGELVGALVDASGDVLALGRSRRLASPQQRVALSARDLHCQFPACTRRHSLEAHHIRMWSEGGPTDMDNMLLLCRSHHIAVHENRLRITRAVDRPLTGALRAGSGFDFHTEGGVLLRAGDELPSDPPDFSDPETAATVTHPSLVDLPNARLGPCEPDIVTIGGGWGFTLDAGVAWLFDAERTLREHRTGEQAQGSA